MKVTVSVPKPCNADWNGMTPQGNGRHCSQCQLVVADLTTASDQELIDLVRRDAFPKCARFDARQLDRALNSNERHTPRLAHAAAVGSLLSLAGAGDASAQVGPPLDPPTDTTQQAPAVPWEGYMLGEVARPLRTIEPVEPPLLGDTVITPTPTPALPENGQRMGKPVAPSSPIVPETVKGDVELQVRGMVKDPMVERIEHGNVSLDTEHPDIDSAVGVHVEPLTIRNCRSSFYYIDGVKVYPDASGRLDTLYIQDRLVRGRIVDNITKEAMPFVSVQVTGHSLHAVTDFDGNFTLQLSEDIPMDGLWLELMGVGYRPKSLAIVQRGSTLPMEALAQRTGEVSGYVVDAQSGRPVKNATILLKGSALAVRTDASGSFAFDRPDGFRSARIELVITCEGYSSVERSTPTSTLPYALPIRLAPTTAQPVEDPRTLPIIGLEPVLQVEQKKVLYTTGDVMILGTPTEPPRTGRLWLKWFGMKP